MTTLQKQGLRAALWETINAGIPTQPYRPRWPGATYNGSTAPRPRPGWLCCTRTVCNENEDAHRYLGSGLSLAVKASSSSARERSAAPRHEGAAGGSAHPHALLRAPPAGLPLPQPHTSSAPAPAQPQLRSPPPDHHADHHGHQHRQPCDGHHRDDEDGVLLAGGHRHCGREAERVSNAPRGETTAWGSPGHCSQCRPASSSKAVGRFAHSSRLLFTTLTTIHILDPF